MPLPEDPTALLREGVQRVLAFLAPAAGGVVADVLATLGSLFVMLFSLFFLLRDGRILGTSDPRSLLPLPERDRERLMTETRDLVIASVGAGLMVAAVRGARRRRHLLGAGLQWAVDAGRCDRVLFARAGRRLGVGVRSRRALAVSLSGEVARAVILAIVAALGVGMVDNVLRPLILSGRTSGKRPGGLSRPAWRRVGVRLHRSGLIILVTAGKVC